MKKLDIETIEKLPETAELAKELESGARETNWSGLYNEPGTNGTSFGVTTLTGCIDYRFEESTSRKLRIKYQYTDDDINGDGCVGSGCSTVADLYVYESNTGVIWTYNTTLPQPTQVDTYRTEIVTPSSAYKYIRVCREHASGSDDWTNNRIRFVTHDSCGDGLCNADENATSCSTDCP